MKKLILPIIIILLMVTLMAGFASAGKADEYVEPYATLLSSTNTDDEGIDCPSLWEESTGEVVFIEGGGR